jgi:uncharacterized protein YjbJ (UPF0337 family)
MGCTHLGTRQYRCSPESGVTMNEKTIKNTSDGAPSWANGTPKQDPKETAQERVHQVTPKKDVAKEPLHAARGDDEVMSQQQQQSMPTSIDAAKGQWKQQVGAAKIAWGKLTEDELLRLEGHEQKLAGLVQERYAITRDEADKQVKTFFEKYRA